jgi:KH domain
VNPLDLSFTRPTIRFEAEASSNHASSCASHGIATIPEGSELVGSCSVPSMPKSPSPLNSSAPTTGTTTTPTSLDQSSSPHGADRVDFPSPQATTAVGSTPDFPDAFHGANASATVPSPWGHSLANDQALHRAEQQGTPPNYGGTHVVGQDPRTSTSHNNPTQYATALKLLVSNNVAGSIIGRSGQTISDLQSQSSTRIKLSQSGDFFPGTQDRVCLVQGDTENVKQALRLLLERLYMLQEQQHSQHLAWQLQKQKNGSGPPFDFMFKVLVPATCCGMIIGKSGSNIKYMEEATGVSSVRLSPKDPASEQVAGYTGSTPGVVFSAASERIVTISGQSVDNCVNCVDLVVDLMVTHPDICRYTNMTTSYSRIVSDAYVTSPSMPASPTMHRQAALPIHARHTSPVQGWEPPTQTTTSGYGQAGLPRRIASSPDLALDVNLPKGHPQDRFGYHGAGGLMHSSGLVPTAVGPQHGIAGAATGSIQPYLFPPPQHHHHVRHQAVRADPSSPSATTDQGSNAAQPFHQSVSGSHSRASLVHHSASAPDLAAFHLEHSLHISSLPPGSLPLHLHPHLHHSGSPPSQHPPPQAPHPPPDFSDAFAPQPPTMTGPGCFTAQILVPDPMVGSILGRGGRALSELQIQSGTRIKISQRGEYMPGTRLRIVTIQGPTGQAVWQAQYIMSQRMVLPQTALPGIAGGSGPPSPHLYPSPRSSYHLLHPVAPPAPSSMTQGSSGAPTHTLPAPPAQSPPSPAEGASGTPETSHRSKTGQASTLPPSGSPSRAPQST